MFTMIPINKFCSYIDGFRSQKSERVQLLRLINQTCLPEPLNFQKGRFLSLITIIIFNNIKTIMLTHWIQLCHGNHGAENMGDGLCK